MVKNAGRSNLNSIQPGSVSHRNSITMHEKLLQSEHDAETRSTPERRRTKLANARLAVSGANSDIGSVSPNRFGQCAAVDPKFAMTTAELLSDHISRLPRSIPRSAATGGLLRRDPTGPRRSRLRPAAPKSTPAQPRPPSAAQAHRRRAGLPTKSACPIPPSVARQGPAPTVPRRRSMRSASPP